MTILVADDDSVTRRVLKDFLVQLKYEPVIVENGQSALDVLAESYPKIKREEVVLLNQGAVLNDRVIGKIVSFNLSAPVRQPVPIFHPSPLALDFLALGLPVSACG